ncbi:hypothetical protein SUGI_0460010 [Cryptomeria japonica]|nr:hypothetical protein SUGI_0460010 [Cryptomeria japonica]
MNFDGACRGNLGESRFGAIIRDELGVMMGAKYNPLGVSTSNITEVTTLEEGLKWCVEKGVDKVMVEGELQEALAEQCDQLFDIDVDGQEAIVVIIEEMLNRERHWVVDANAIGNVVMELEEEWVSILGPFFNSTYFLSDVEASNTEDEFQVAAKELKSKKENFMGNAWDVFCAGVSTGDLGPFRRMMNEDLGWLSDNNIEKVASLGDCIATILRLM